MKPLEPPDARHLLAAEGWLELGNAIEANEELDRITPTQRVHPDVLEVRWQIFANGKQWDACLHIANAITKLAPGRLFGWVHRAYALHELKRTAEARVTLLPVVEQFKSAYVVPYNLACYAAQLGQIAEAKAWLNRAFQTSGDPSKVKLAALDDPDLEPLWHNLREL